MVPIINFYYIFIYFSTYDIKDQISPKWPGCQMSTLAKSVSLMVLYNNVERNLGHIKIVKISHQPIVHYSFSLWDSFMLILMLLHYNFHLYAVSYLLQSGPKLLGNPIFTWYFEVQNEQWIGLFGSKHPTKDSLLNNSGSLMLHI